MTTNTKLVCFTNCLLALEDGTLVPRDLWIDSELGLILDAQHTFFAARTRPSRVVDLHGAILAPGLLDIQINGAFGFDFSIYNNNEGIPDTPEEESRADKDYLDSLVRVADRITETGVTGLVPTIVTQQREIYPKLLSLLAPQDTPHGAHLLGWHAEGPFLQPAKRGAHTSAFLLSAPDGISSFEAVYGSTALDKHTGGVRIITAAPELEGVLGSVAPLAERGVVVSIGHSIAPTPIATAAVAHGARLITHLFNAMPQLHHRDPSIIGLLGSSQAGKGDAVGVPRPSHAAYAPGKAPPESVSTLGGKSLLKKISTVNLTSPTKSEQKHEVSEALQELITPPQTPLVARQRLAQRHRFSWPKVASSPMQCPCSILIFRMVYMNGGTEKAGQIRDKLFIEALTHSLEGDAIKCATYNPAKCLGIEARKGTLRAGADADLVVMTAEGEILSTWLSTIGLSLVSTTSCNFVLKHAHERSKGWPYMLDYVAVDIPSDQWTDTQEAWWLVMESTTSGLVHITHIQFLTLLYPSGIEARLIFLLLGPLAIASSGMVFTSMNSAAEVRDLGDAVRNVCNSALSLLFTAALLAWGFVIHRTPAWRTDGGTAAFGIGAIILAVLSTVSNFLQIFLNRRIHWLLSLTWAIVLWQSFLGWWWWVGSGEGVNEVEDMLERERRRRRKRAKKRKKEAQAAASGADPQRGILRTFRRRGSRAPDDNEGSVPGRAGTSSGQDNASSHPDGSSHPENTLSNPETHSHTTSSHTSTAPSGALGRAWASIRHAHRRATTVQAIEQVELRNTTPGWGLGSFGVMEAERRRAGREVERREGERRLVDRDDATGNDTADGRDDDTEGVRSGGESDAETRPGRTAYPPLGWTQRDLDQQEAARRSRRNEREMRREGRQLSGDEEGGGVGGTWGLCTNMTGDYGTIRANATCIIFVDFNLNLILDIPNNLLIHELERLGLHRYDSHKGTVGDLMTSGYQLTPVHHCKIYIMENIEGTFRIVNIKYNKAITIPAYHPSTVVGWQAPHQPNQQWFIRRAGDKYHIEDSLYGRYLVPDYTDRGARINLGRYPVNWEILSVGENKYVFKVAGHDLVLDLHGSEDGAEILINPLHRVTFGSGFSGNTPEVFSAASKDALIARLTDQLDERENQIAEQEERIENQIQEIQELKREAETRNQHLEELNIAVNKLLIRLAEGNASAPITQPSSNDHIESEGDNMLSLEPGTYRIINIARKKALRVPDESTNTITSWQVQDEPNQKWFIQRAGNGYRFKNCGHGKYLSVHNTQCNSQVYHGSPTTWKIIPRTSSGYLIQLEAVDRVLDLHDRGEVYIWPANDVEPQKVWDFERLGCETGDESKETEGIIPSGQPEGDDSTSRDESVTKKPLPALDPIAIRDIQIAQQARRIQLLEAQLSQRDQEIERLHDEVAVLKSQESSQVSALHERTMELEKLVEKLFEQESKRPNNAA
ncbi:carbohydrate esterase family 9 protein [Rhizoctonia solani]|uniref:Carbohydrate esterase family 9 protein n=1 Tax=Rhizoctonia solani TaxID=456999 RepID=A0A8H8T1W0_9AGAM|nr:carbohydrate esterase family 9 protein [Rhizoctonia solani]QRW25182.1 carbohydrate esterase family 9 protein [Rhizoctonia solani]